MRNKELNDNPILTAGTATIAGLWVIAPEFWLWVGSIFTERGVIVCSVIWLSLQSLNMISGWIGRWMDRQRSEK